MCVSAAWCECVFTRARGGARGPLLCVRAFGTDGKTSRGLRCNWKRSEVVIAF